MSLFKNFFGASSTEKTQVTSPLDLVTNAAGLVSNPQEIDPLLDKVRGVTARLRPNEELSSADEAALFDVYLQIEAYLSSKEPLRTFAKEELRNRVSQDLRTRLEAYERKE